MKDAHRQAFEWLQKAKDGTLDGVSGNALSQHLAECRQCRQDAALLAALAQAASTSLPQPAHPVTGQQVAIAVQRGRAQQANREPLRGIAWGAAVFAVILFTGLANDLVQPHSAAAAAWLPGGLVQAPAASQIAQVDPSQVVFWTLIFFSGLLAPLLVGCAGVAMGVQRWYTGWLAFLLVGFSLGLGLFFYSLFILANGMGIYTLLLLPFLVTLLELIVIHLWSQREQWNWLTFGLTGMYLAGIVVLFALMLWRNQGELGFSLVSLAYLVIYVAFPSVTWLAWDWRKPWRWLVYLTTGFLLLGLLLFFLVYSPFIIARSPWIRVLGPACSILWAPAAVTLASRLIYTSQASPQPRRRMGWTAAALVLLFASLFADIHSIALQNSVAEDAIMGGFMTWFACAAAVAAGVAIAWKLKGKRLWISLALIGLFTFGLFPALLVPDGTARQVTEQRAAQIDQAVLRFYSQNQRYPATLAELEPGFLWQVPAPVTSNRTEWCYDGGADYYRLGYFDNYQFTFPGMINFKVYAQAGKLPGQPPPCQVLIDQWQP